MSRLQESTVKKKILLGAIFFFIKKEILALELLILQLIRFYLNYFCGKITTTIISAHHLICDAKKNSYVIIKHLFTFGCFYIY